MARNTTRATVTPATALLAAQRFPEAIEHLVAAVRLDPGHALAHGNLASALARTGRVPEAIAHFRIALRLDPGNAAWRENLRKLEALRPSNPPRN